MDERPQGKSMRELRAIVDASNKRFDAIGEVWSELTDAQQAELVETAKLMHAGEPVASRRADA